jgi:hypothetical protein
MFCFTVKTAIHDQLDIPKSKNIQVGNQIFHCFGISYVSREFTLIKRQPGTTLSQDLTSFASEAGPIGSRKALRSAAGSSVRPGMKRGNNPSTVSGNVIFRP